MQGTSTSVSPAVRLRHLYVLWTSRQRSSLPAQAYSASTAGACLTIDAAPVCKTLLYNGAHPDAAADNGATPLHVASACGNARAVRALYEHSEDLDLHTVLPELLCTPLHLAVASADEATVAALLDLGASASIPAHGGVLPIHTAAFVGQPATLVRLLDSAADVGPTAQGETPLHMLCSHEHPDLLEGTMAVLSAVDWIGEVRIQPQLMHALAESVAQDPAVGEVAALRHNSRVLGHAAAIQAARSAQAAPMRHQLGKEVHSAMPDMESNVLEESSSGAPAEKSGCFTVRSCETCWCERKSTCVFATLTVSMSSHNWRSSCILPSLCQLQGALCTVCRPFCVLWDAQNRLSRPQPSALPASAALLDRKRRRTIMTCIRAPALQHVPSRSCREIRNARALHCCWSMAAN
jgi:Ankyrin repeats (3 copies)